MSFRVNKGASEVNSGIRRQRMAFLRPKDCTRKPLGVVRPRQRMAEDDTSSARMLRKNDPAVPELARGTQVSRKITQERGGEEGSGWSRISYPVQTSLCVCGTVSPTFASNRCNVDVHGYCE